MKNIELKVKVDNFDNIVEILKDINAEHSGHLHQIDTYYYCAQGRLKLREINHSIFELIFYKRPNKFSSRLSDYQVVDISRQSLGKIKLELYSSYGEKNIVRKERGLWIYKNTRVHLDKVEGLGSFLELETVVKDIDIKQAKKEHNEVINFLKLLDYKKIDKSYGDLFPSKKKNSVKDFSMKCALFY